MAVGTEAAVGFLSNTSWLEEEAARNEKDYQGALADGLIVSAEEVFGAALAEHPEWEEREDLDPTLLTNVARLALGRIASNERVARVPLRVSPQDARNIGAIWYFSATGLAGVNRADAEARGYTKNQENKAYLDAPYKQDWDHARVSLGGRLALQVARVRLGEDPMVPYESMVDGSWWKDAQNSISEAGPNVFYSGYKTETDNAKDLLGREGTVIPFDRAFILSTPLRNTVDQVRTFEYPTPDDEGKATVLIGHAPHLVRIGHMLSRFNPLGEEAPAPYVVPVPTAPEGRKAMSMQEARGLLYFIMTDQAAVVPHEYRTLEAAA